ncbi:multifunctional CCA addition/repair protein [Legionella taurinensis]|uniref:Multifunctional CCA protein n=1 Tax=Legionella taurinensis TaxID=70611 RepID=A0AB38N104_9GAMM|nr:multifunctional CCA addition/repair protein [Legionella taurinensis]MDX1838802.1 multifunctional CCA addition/repair protein [Legionella taurinensis]PUT38662.1 multifunctional CCA addition/repair protein [Legionella taurinensis]PUT39860.1 multifunctional CCA addition/repair protein [Legionella taurinensis]PUT41852.1 multifunctional CCA addition/repair protein [Legionella taurinensis]PUT45347.1 multifunctional CCA addition/repair protein [Legionella taurinensis]
MKVYLVGGAVRDRLLGYPVKEQDWVVVGGTPEQLLQQGYQQVGKDFPVFLHPETHEEYALARTERKKGPGYYGFDCQYDVNVTLEEDLLRRDLTINAMAMDEQGRLIDPYYGAKDLEGKWLRHVSPAFAEDPVRVLRVARFAARYAHLGFRVADETRLLMYKMVNNGELHHLVAERVWQELQRALSEKNPDVFIMTLRSCGALSVILPEIQALFGVPNTRRYHPEVDSGIHTLMVLQAAVELTEDTTARFAALVHDLGKALTPMRQWPKHHGHEESGVSVIESLCHRLRVPAEYRKLAVLVSRFHLLIHRVEELRPQTIVKVLERTDAFRRPQQFEKLLTVCEADSLGKGKNCYGQRAFWRAMYAVCNQISAQALLNEGYQGAAIKDELSKRRAAAIKSDLDSWENYEKQQ